MMVNTVNCSASALSGSALKSYYPALRKKPSQMSICVSEDKPGTPDVSAVAQPEPVALFEIPSPSRARATREARLHRQELEELRNFDGVCSPSNDVSSLHQGPCPQTPPQTDASTQHQAFKEVEQSRSRTPPPPPVPSMCIPVGKPRARFSEEWEVDLGELSFKNLVGTGTTAEVYRASWHGTDVAVKQLRSPLLLEFKRELAVLLQLRHPNLVLFMGASSIGRPVIISEFCSGGTLFELLHQRRDLSLSRLQASKIALDTATGMNFLHRRHVVHRDLKSLNLLLAARVDGPDDAPWTKIADFGLSRNLPQHQSAQTGGSDCMMTGGVGTCHWMAPEVLNGNQYDEKVDVYSYAIVLYELVCRRIPYFDSGLEPVSIAIAVCRGIRPDLKHVPKDCVSELRSVMERCWSHCPADRPSFDGILETLR